MELVEDRARGAGVNGSVLQATRLLRRFAPRNDPRGRPVASLTASLFPPAAYAGTRTVALRSSLPQPTRRPRIATMNDRTTTQYITCR